MPTEGETRHHPTSGMSAKYIATVGSGWYHVQIEGADAKKAYAAAGFGPRGAIEIPPWKWLDWLVEDPKITPEMSYRGSKQYQIGDLFRDTNLKNEYSPWYYK